MAELALGVCADFLKLGMEGEDPVFFPKTGLRLLLKTDGAADQDRHTDF